MKFSRRTLITNLFKQGLSALPDINQEESDIPDSIGTLNEFPVGSNKFINNGLIEIISNEYGLIAQELNTKTYFGLHLIAGQIYLDKKKKFNNLHFLSIMTGEMSSM